MRPVRSAGLLALLFAVLCAGAWLLRSRGGSTSTVLAVLAAPNVEHAPQGVRIRVQVLNTTRTRGLARRATRLLRDRGFDVVEMGTTTPQLDTTLVLDRSGHPDWAGTVARVMMPARSETRRDSSRYLDVTVLLGSSWRPPAQPLDP